jgi:hypothetical protein
MLFSFSFILTVVLCGERVNNIQVLEKSKNTFSYCKGIKLVRGRSRSERVGEGGRERIGEREGLLFQIFLTGRVYTSRAAPSQ